MLAPVHQILVSQDLGGAGQIALNVADHLRRQGRSSRVWIPGAGKAWTEAEKLGLNPDRFALEGALTHSTIRAGFANWRFSRQLKKANRGVVHVHGPLYYGALRRGLNWAGVQRVVHVHLEEQIDSLRWAFRQAPDMVITCASFLVEMVQRSLPESALAKTRVIAVPNAVDTVRFSPGSKEEARSRVGAPLDRPLILMLANLAPHKGQETAIRAVAHLRRRGVEVNCWLAGVERGGAAAFTAKLKKLVADNGIQDIVKFLGQRDDAPDLLRAADCFLLPSRIEGLPLAVLEAQASGTPVLAGPTPGVREVISDGDTGFLIPAWDVVAYAQRLETLLKDRPLRERIAGSALARTRREHSWPVYCRRIEELYANLANDPVGLGWHDAGL
jgi:glycosyltransferase involved in cell wall biosynthesis